MSDAQAGTAKTWRTVGPERDIDATPLTGGDCHAGPAACRDDLELRGIRTIEHRIGQQQGTHPSDIGQPGRAGRQTDAARSHRKFKTVGRACRALRRQRKSQIWTGYGWLCDIGGKVFEVLRGQATAQRRHLRDDIDGVFNGGRVSSGLADAVKAAGQSAMAIDAAHGGTPGTFSIVIQPLPCQGICRACSQWYPGAHRNRDPGPATGETHGHA